MADHGFLACLADESIGAGNKHSDYRLEEESLILERVQGVIIGPAYAIREIPMR